MRIQALTPTKLQAFEMTMRNNPLLSDNQLLLLHAALDKGQPALEAWLRWEKQSDWEHASLDRGSYRLLPTVYHNMMAYDNQISGLLRLKGLYRRAWFENSRLYHFTKPALNILVNAGLPILLFKGVSLAQFYYRDKSSRLMGDIDILVQEEQVFTALELLQGAGWYPTHVYSAKQYLQNYPSINLAHSNGGAIDLHRRIFADDLSPGVDEILWKRAQPFTFEGFQLLRPAAVDEFLLICVHGWRWNETPSIRWVVDAAQILTMETDFDWDALIAEAARRHMVYKLQQTLHFMKEEFALDIPGQVIAGLDTTPTAWFEKMETRQLAAPIGFIPASAYRIFYWHARGNKSPYSITWWLGLIRKYFIYLKLVPVGEKFRVWIAKRINMGISNRKI